MALASRCRFVPASFISLFFGSSDLYTENLHVVAQCSLEGRQFVVATPQSATADTKPMYLPTLASIPDDLFIVGSVESCSSFEAGIHWTAGSNL